MTLYYRTRIVFPRCTTVVLNLPGYVPKYVISDIAISFEKGDFIRGAKAAYYLEPFKTVHLVGSLLIPFVTITYGDYYVPWRHRTWPYTHDQITWRNTLGATLLAKKKWRIWFGTMAAAYLLDHLKKKWFPRTSL